MGKKHCVVLFLGTIRHCWSGKGEVGQKKWPRIDPPYSRWLMRSGTRITRKGLVRGAGLFRSDKWLVVVSEYNREGLIDGSFPERRLAMWLLSQLIKLNRTLTVDPRARN